MEFVYGAMIVLFTMFGFYGIFKMSQSEGKSEMNGIRTRYGGGSFIGGLVSSFMQFFWLIFLIGSFSLAGWALTKIGDLQSTAKQEAKVNK